MTTEIEENDHDDDDHAIDEVECDPDSDDAQLMPAGQNDGSRRLTPDDDRPAVGSWWWVDSKSDSDCWKPADYDEPGKKWIACVTEVGSNYAKVKGVRFNSRIALDDFYKGCAPEPNPDAYISGKVGFHKSRVRELMGEIQQVCHRLGVPLRQALAEAQSPEASQALAVVHGVDDVKKYGKELVKAKDKTLPELFAKVKEQHEQMAKWMKADLIPAEAELSAVKEVVEVLENKIHTVELYAGLQEQLVQVRKGKAAGVDAKVHLMQRRHYMDEECLVAYEAGGMDFKDIKAFDKWMARAENFARILPHDRTIVAFRIRRHDKEYGGEHDTLANFIKFMEFDKENKRTFLYIRNGQQLWRMETSIDFDEELFSSKEDSELLGNSELWIKESEHDLKHADHGGIITGRQRDSMIDDYQARRRHFAQQLWQWHRAGKPEWNWLYTAVESDHGMHGRYGWEPGSVHAQSGKPHKWHSEFSNPVEGHVRLTPENIYYDDAMKRIKRAAFKHNRVAVVIQGLLDRSTCLHPHAPWRIWTPEGFAAGIELVYDVSRALTPGEAPDFEAYRKQLNKSLRVGCTTIGQKRAWSEAMEAKYGGHGDRERWRWRSRVGSGPAIVDVVRKLWKDGSCDFAFTRDRQTPKWVNHPEKHGYLQATYPDMPVTWRCPGDVLMCVNAYTIGDFHLFFDDPRTRQDYIKWAPFLLGAEDWHHRQRNAKPDKPSVPLDEEDDE